MDARDFSGAWTLLSWVQTYDDGRTQHPMGSQPSGQLIYTADGRVSVMAAAADRANLSQGQWTSPPEETAAAYASFMAYGGTFEVIGNEVLHHIQVSSYPNWVGATQRRQARLEEDRLILGGRLDAGTANARTVELIWRRAPSPKLTSNQGNTEMITLTLEDRFELQDLYSRYAHAVDANDGKTWSMCYTHDGVFAATTGRLAGKTYRGRAELEQLGSDPNREPKTRHWNCNYYFTPREDHIEGRCYVMRVEVDGDAPVIAASAVYHDIIVREDGQWRFKSRRPQLDLQIKR